MPNTVTQRTLMGSGSDKHYVNLINIVSDGSEETDLVIYDNSALVGNVLKGNVKKIVASGSACLLRFEWDQTTDSPICSIDPSTGQKMCFKDVGGVNNPGGSGATGDVVLTTAGLDAGDEVTIILYVEQT